jgi:primosomal protein N' (replication factor Y)
VFLSVKYSIALPLHIQLPIFTYSLEHDGNNGETTLTTGQIVTVPLRNHERVGIVIKENDEYEGKTSNVLSVLPYSITAQYVKFAFFIARYTISNFGDVLKLFIPFSIDKLLAPEKNIKMTKQGNFSEITLNEPQSKALAGIRSFDNTFKTILLHGITGSGKTEVFLEFTKNKEQVLIMVPEIALSNDLAMKVAARSCSPVYIWHHSISPSKKIEIWKKAVNGERMTVVGARSAMFIPFSQLSCIIIDEEHDNSFKQSENIRYNARDMSIYLASLLNIPIILSSATPSLETYNNAMAGKYEYIQLKSRYHENASFPRTHIEDLRKTKGGTVLSQYSINCIEKCLQEKKQALIFINRRGHTPKILCASCGWKAMCPACDSCLCYHEKEGLLKCHYCGYSMKNIVRCPKCDKQELIGSGFGVEKASNEIAKTFPKARIISVSSDNMNTPSKIDRTIKAIQNHEVDIIVGTQILAKGHNFMDLEVIIITCVDTLLYGEDFRASENAFQMLHQVSGRAGRAGGPSDYSVVVFQTFDPDDRLVQLLASNDMSTFYEIELQNRKTAGMPPFGKIVSVIISSNSKTRLNAFSKDLLMSSTKKDGFRIIGPISPGISKLRNMYRLRFVVLSKSIPIQDFVRNWISSVSVPKDIRLCIDVDPYDFM